MKVLVTGGAGFIGSHLSEALCRRGARVVVLDNLSSGTLANLAWRRATDAVDFIEGDAGDAVLVAKLLAGCDWVFHQAAMPSVPRSIEDPSGSHQHNLNATLTLLLAAREAGVKRFLLASSSSIYGDAEAPVKAETLPPRPLSPYALQKYAAERYTQMFHTFHGLPTVSLRYFNVFGPRQSFDSPYSGVIARFCQACLGEEPPVIFGDGTQSRDFTYVENVVEANLQVAETTPERVAGRVFNVACGVSLDLLGVARCLGAITGRAITPRFGPGRAGDIQHSCADISAAREAFGFSPRVGWEEGLRRTLEWYRENGGRG